VEHWGFTYGGASSWDREDLNVSDAQNLFRKLVSDIQDWRSKNQGCVLFNCHAGQNRATTLAIAIMRSGSQGSVPPTPVQALRHVRQCVSKVAWLGSTEENYKLVKLAYGAAIGRPWMTAVHDLNETDCQEFSEAVVEGKMAVSPNGGYWAQILPWPEGTERGHYDAIKEGMWNGVSVRAE
jgi:hypothetical protein